MRQSATAMAAAASAAASSATKTNGPLLRNCLGALLVNKAPNTTSRSAYEPLVLHAMSLDTETVAFAEACKPKPNYDQPQLKKKVGAGAGHIGTLDPFATGALPVFMGIGTKLVNLFSSLDYDKNYLATLTLGSRTESGDLDTPVVSSDENWTSVTNEQVVDQGKSLVGNLVQRANIYSAQKVEGKPLYWYAQQNLDPPYLPEKTVKVIKCDAELKDPQTVTIAVQCGSGTYIRDLGEQLASRLGTCGHLTALHRVRRGLFEVDEVPPVGSESIVVKQYTIGDLLDMLNVKVLKFKPETFSKRMDECMRCSNSPFVVNLFDTLSPGMYCLQIDEHPVVLYEKHADVKGTFTVLSTFPVPPAAFLPPGTFGRPARGKRNSKPIVGYKTRR
jgi:tRNA pseudouridine(55) synthase